MNSHTGYKTKQKEILLQYLRTIPGVHVTAGDVCRHLKTQGETIGQSTVYRQLERLVDEGILNKYVIDGSSPACFEFVGEEEHADAEICFHCKCEKCGRLIHLHCEELEEIQGHLFKEHRFTMDPVRTVFYGLCQYPAVRKYAAAGRQRCGGRADAVGPCSLCLSSGGSFCRRYAAEDPGLSESPFK